MKVKTGSSSYDTSSQGVVAWDACIPSHNAWFKSNYSASNPASC